MYVQWPRSKRPSRRYLLQRFLIPGRQRNLAAVLFYESKGFKAMQPIFLFSSLAVCAMALFALPGNALAKISANHKAGAVIVGPTTTSCDSSIEGALRWSSVEKTHEMCDGDTWRKIIATSDSGVPSTPPATAGYFVLTVGSWDGDLKTAGGGTSGFDGANKLCLSDLTNNDWNGKDDAQARGILNLDNIRAFLCYGDNNTTSGSAPFICQNPLANTMYYFAVSGDATKGGAFFTADGEGRGPENSQNWSGVNYFASDAEIWTGRPHNSATQWQRGGEQWSSPACDVQWDGYGTPGNAGNPDYGLYGSTNNSDHKRWRMGTQACSSSLKLVCMVHP